MKYDFSIREPRGWYKGFNAHPFPVNGFLVPSQERAVGILLEFPASLLVEDFKQPPGGGAPFSSCAPHIYLFFYPATILQLFFIMLPSFIC